MRCHADTAFSWPLDSWPDYCMGVRLAGRSKLSVSLSVYAYYAFAGCSTSKLFSQPSLASNARSSVAVTMDCRSFFSNLPRDNSIWRLCRRPVSAVCPLVATYAIYICFFLLQLVQGRSEALRQCLSAQCTQHDTRLSFRVPSRSECPSDFLKHPYRVPTSSSFIRYRNRHQLLLLLKPLCCCSFVVLTFFVIGGVRDGKL